MSKDLVPPAPHINNADLDIESGSIVPTNVSCNPPFVPTHSRLIASEHDSGSTEYPPLNDLSYLPICYSDTPASYDISITAAYEDDTYSLQSAGSNDVLEEATPATAVRMTPVTPTTVHIRHSIKRQKQTQPQALGSVPMPGTSLFTGNAIKSDVASVTEGNLSTLVHGATNGNAE
jgi:hypothetical protein